MNQLDIESSHYNNLKLNLACSFISGFISSPLDIIRIRFSSLTTIPATCLYFCCFEYLKLKKLQYNNVFQEKGIINDKPNKNDDLNFISYFSLAFLSEAISCIIFVPIDVIKERLQAQKYLQLKEHKTTSKLIKEYIYKQGLSRLYRGYISTCLSFFFFFFFFPYRYPFHI
ncbi:hypothetical protein PFAG_00066 [Plasmodium falciparum Santa Lucia]|uniref:Mitochondrial carrier protein n=1 Tax=Plasmodium falciparum Santa Lucia TaxID=478859 RepID=W7FX71_PLAFA|nr:hypothetical protein PFAG_00066 [Plasmodium falciparum Santa Lucia]